MKNRILPLSLFVLFMPLAAASQTFTLPEIKTGPSHPPVITKGDFKAATFTDPDGSFQIDLPAHTNESVQQLDWRDLELDAAGVEYLWYNGKIGIQIKAVYSDHFPDADTLAGRRKYWKKTQDQIKAYETQNGSKILSERDLSTNKYLAVERKELTPLRLGGLTRYYFTGKRWFTVMLFVKDKNLQSDVQKAIESFKVLK
jgi:hypothetical protein